MKVSHHSVYWILVVQIQLQLSQEIQPQLIMKEFYSYSSWTILSFLYLVLSSECYSTVRAYELLHFSRIAYEDPAIIEGWSCVIHCSLVTAVGPQVFEDQGNMGFIAYNPTLEAIVVTFRGSDYGQPEDWIVDLAYFRSDYDSCNGCKVHTGFLTSSQSLREKVRNKIASFRQVYPSAPLYMAGHSLGGALATMQALDNQESGTQVDQVYIFGNPRVGNRVFAQYYNQLLPNTFRVVNYGDLVAHMPPMVAGYYHCGHEVWYNPRGMQNYDICPSQYWSCANSLSFWNFSYNDHRIYQYVRMPIPEEQKLEAIRQTLKPASLSSARLEQMEDQKVQAALKALRKQHQNPQKDQNSEENQNSDQNKNTEQTENP